MEKTTLSEQLRELAKSPKKSKASQLFEILDDVEFALSAGVTHAVVVQKLAQNGLQFTLPSFENTLHRVRQRKKKKSVVETKATISHVTSLPIVTPKAEIEESKQPQKRQSFQYEGTKNIDASSLI
jgi:septal ring-binding cell division protein DamX